MFIFMQCYYFCFKKCFNMEVYLPNNGKCNSEPTKEFEHTSGKISDSAIDACADERDSIKTIDERASKRAIVASCTGI